MRTIKAIHFFFRSSPPNEIFLRAGPTRAGSGPLGGGGVCPLEPRRQCPRLLRRGRRRKGERSEELYQETASGAVMVSQGGMHRHGGALVSYGRDGGHEKYVSYSMWMSDHIRPAVGGK